MQKFSFDENNNSIIRHNLVPEMLIQIIYNREDPELNIMGDCFELFEFRGNEIILKWLVDEDELEEIEDYSHIRSILRRAWGWYKSNWFIKQKESEPGPIDTARYSLSFRLWAKNETKTHDWLLIDKIFLISIKWKEGKFNESQIVEQLPGFNSTNEMQLHTLMRQAGDWLVIHHKEKL